MGRAREQSVEEALLRGVIKLRRLIRDVDTTGRLAENRFGLILEGLSSRRPSPARPSATLYWPSSPQ
jgi:hypothetical protein